MATQLDELIDRELARRDFLTFCRRVAPFFRTDPPHVPVIASHLQALADDEIEALMVFIQPQVGKSLMCARLFPAWVAGRSKAAIITASYNDRLPLDHMKALRTFVSSAEWPFSGQMVGDSFAADRWTMTNGSEGRASGLGGGLTGFGTTLGVIDDPVAGREQANSEIEREKAWEWYNDVFRTRLRANAKQVLMMTRWHEDDLAGRILNSSMAKKFTVLRIPTVAEDNDPLGRAPGTVGVWLESDGGPKLPDDILETLDSRTISSLYQQRPTAAGGGSFFKRAWFQNRYDSLPDDRPHHHELFHQMIISQPQRHRTVIGIDCASKTGLGNDFSAFVTMTTDGKDLFVRDVVNERLEFPNLVRRAVQLFEIHQPRALVVEDASSGTQLIQMLRSQTRLPVIAIPPRGTKQARVDSITVYFESGRVKLPSWNPEWLEAYVDQLCAFDAAKHDDMVDATELAVTALLRGVGRQPPQTTRPIGGVTSYFER